MNSQIQFGNATLVKVSFCLLLLLVVTPGCSQDKSAVEEATLTFVKAIQAQDTETLDRIIDWERYYAYGKGEGGKAGDEGSSIDVEGEKALLLKVLSRDRGLAVQYLTSESSIEDTSINGDEARAVLLQVDRANGHERTVTLLLNKTQDEGWKIYRFTTEDVNATR